MAEIESNININADTTGAVEAIKNLQRQISAFQISMARGNASAQSAAKKMQQNLIDNIDATGKFNASLTNIKSTTESFTDALERNKLTMGEYFRFAGGASKTFGRSFKREFDVIQKVAIERVKDLQTQYVSLGRDANGALKAIKIRPLTLDMKDFGVQTQIAAQRAQLFNQLIEQGSTNLLNWGKNTQWAGRQLMVGFTVPLTMMGTVASKTFMQIEEQVIKLRRVYGDFATSVEDTDKMVKSIRSLANEFTKWGVSVEKTMELAADAAATGKMGADLIDQVTEATRLAVLGQVEQQDALETTMSITNAFGTATEQLARKIDFLNAVENQSVTAIEDLTIAIPKAGPVIKQLGGDVEDLAFFLTAMKEGGINASEGANALKSGLASLINPTNKASEFMAKFGINITKIVEANKGDVKGLVLDFAQALDTLDPLNRARSIEQLFGKFQFARLSTLFQNVIKQGSQAERVLGLAGASAEELAIVSERELAKLEQSTTYRFQKATADFQAALAPIGEEFLKAITPIIKLGTDVLKAFNSMSGGAKQFVTNLTLIVGGVGPALLMTVGLIANGVANLIKFFNSLRNIFAGTSESGTDVASSTEYMTQAQIEAAAVASSLDQEHNKLVQTFGVEAEALSKLTSVYERAIRAQAAYTGKTPPAIGNTDVSTGYAKGVLSVPGPKGAGDIVPAMLSPGEAVIPAKQTQKYKPLIRGIIAGNLRGYATGGIIEDKQEDRYVVGAGKYASQEQIEEAVYKAAQYVYADSPRFAPEGSRSGLTFFGGLAHSLAMDRANVYRRQEIADIESIVASGGVKSKFTTGQTGRGGFEHLDRSRLTVSEMIYGQASEGIPGSEIYGYLKSPTLPYDISQILPIIRKVAASMGKDPSILENEIMGQLLQDNDGILKNPRVAGYGELDLKFNREAIMASNAQAIVGDSLSSSTDDLLEYNARMKAIRAMPIAKLLSGNYTEEERIAMFGPSNSPAFYEVAIPGSAATLANVDSAQLLDSVSTVRSGKGFGLSQVSAERVNQVKAMLGKVGIDLDTGMYNEEAMQALLSQYGAFEPSTIGTGIKGYNDKKTFESQGLTPASLTDINGKPITIGDVISQYERVTKGGTGWDKDSKYWRRIPGFEDGVILGQGKIDTSLFNTDYGQTPGGFQEIEGVMHYLKKPRNKAEATAELVAAELYRRLGGSGLAMKAFPGGVIGSEAIPGVIDTYETTLESWIKSQSDPIGASEALLKALKNYSENDAALNSLLGNIDTHPGNIMFDPASGKLINMDVGNSILTGFDTWDSEFSELATDEAVAVKERILAAIKGAGGRDNRETLTALAEKYGFGNLAGLGLDEPSNKANAKGKISLLQKLMGFSSNATGDELLNADPRNNKFIQQLIAENPGLEKRLSFGKLATTSGDSMVESLAQLYFRARDAKTNPIFRYANGVVSVPGPKGAGDIIPAMLSPGEAVIPAKQTAKYKPLIQGMIAGNLPGFMAGTDGVRGRRDSATNIELAREATTEFKQFEDMYGAGQISERQLDVIAQRIARAADFENADVQVVIDAAINAIDQIAQAGVSSLQTFKRTMDYGISNLPKLVSQYGKNIPLEAIRANADESVLANTQEFVPNIIQNLKAEFSHLTGSIDMSVEEFKKLGIQLSESGQTLIDEAGTKGQGLSVKTGLGIDLMGMLNTQMANAGAKVSDVLADMVKRGSESWSTSIAIGGGNVQALRPQTEAFSKIFQNVLASEATRRGASVVVDTKAQADAIGSAAIGLDEVAQIALGIANLQPELKEVVSVLRTAETTATSIRTGGSERSALTDRSAGGLEIEVLDAQLQELQNNAKKAAEQFIETYIGGFTTTVDEYLQINSPSKVMQDTAAGVGDGIVQGVESATPAATQAGQNLANEIVRPPLTPELVDQAYEENAQFDAMRAQQDAAQRKQRSMMNAYRVGRGISYGLTGLSMVASFIPQIGEVAQTVTPSLTAFSTGISMLPGPLGLALGAALGLGTVFMQVQAKLNETRTEAARLAESLGTGAKALQKYAEAAGKATASDIMERRRQNARAGISVRPGKLKFGSGFVAGESGQAMIADMQKASEEYGKSVAIQKLGTQLATAIVSGVLTGQQAKEIAYSIGRELKDTTVTIGAIAEINDIVGPNGKRFENNPVEVSGKLVGNIASELEKVNAQVDALTGDLFRGFDLAKLEGQSAALTVDLIATQQQVIDSLELEYSRRIDNLNAQNKFNEAAKLTNELEEKKRELMSTTSTQLKSILNVGTEGIINSQISLSTPFTSSYGNTYNPNDPRSAEEQLGAVGYQEFTDAINNATNVNGAVAGEITARIKAEYMGTEEESMINTLMDKLNANEPFNVLMKLGISSGTMDPTSVNVFQAMIDEGAFGDKTQVVKDILVNVATSGLGTVGSEQLMQILQSVPPGATSQELRVAISTLVEGNLSDPAFAQQTLDTLSTFTAYAASYPAGIDITAILEFYTDPTNKANFDAAMSDIQNFKRLERRGKLNIRSISEFLTDEEGMLAVKENEKFFSKLDPSQKFLYVQTIRTIYETIGTQEINEYRAANAEATAGLTDLEVKARIANEAAESLVENSSAINDLGDSAKDAANEVGGLANEFDALTAKIDMYQKALSVISLKEEKINKKYDERAKALEEVAKINEEIAQQQQNQLDIADALSRGDIAAAARAVQKYRADQATLEIQKQQDALEKARENEIAQVAFAGFTREELEKKLQRLEMRLARRDYRESVDYFRNQGTPTNTGTTDDTTDPDKPKPPKPPKDTNGNDDKFLTTAELNAKVEEKRAKRIAELNKQVATGEITTTEYSAALRKLENDLVIYRNSLEDEGRRRRLLTREINKSGKAYEESGLLAASGYSAALDAADQYARKAKAASDLASGKITLKAYENIVEGMASGGMVKGYASGGVIPKYFAFGGNALGSDTVAAMLSPGEFVVKRSAVQSYGVDNLKAINNGTAAPSSGVYNYSINVNVSTDASPEQIARAVAQNVKRTESYRIRGNRL